MAGFYVDLGRIINTSQNIVNTVSRLKAIQHDLRNSKLTGVYDSQSIRCIDQLIARINVIIPHEAVKMKSLGEALETIANIYGKTEQEAWDIKIKGITDIAAKLAPLEPGTDKRNDWNKFWDWVTSKEPDAYDTTTLEQEKAADTAIKREIWKILQNEKYSQENWDNSSIDERKQILQDYMNELIEAYGLKHVNPKIQWDSKAKYTATSVAWGYYTHGLFNHKVTLNAQVLTDEMKIWDSYNLLSTVSHELRHAYQHEAVDHPTDYMVSKETIDVWKKNFKNYIESDGSEEKYKKYREQPVEVDARDFEISRDAKL